MELLDTLRARCERRTVTEQVDCGGLGVLTAQALPLRECAALSAGADGDRAVLYAACRELQTAGETLRAEGAVFTPDEIMQMVSDEEAAAGAGVVRRISGLPVPVDTAEPQDTAEEPVATELPDAAEPLNPPKLTEATETAETVETVETAEAAEATERAEVTKTGASGSPVAENAESRFREKPQVSAEKTAMAQAEKKPADEDAIPALLHSPVKTPEHADKDCKTGQGAPAYLNEEGTEQLPLTRAANRKKPEIPQRERIPEARRPQAAAAVPPRSQAEAEPLQTTFFEAQEDDGPARTAAVAAFIQNEWTMEPAPRLNKVQPEERVLRSGTRRGVETKRQEDFEESLPDRLAKTAEGAAEFDQRVARGLLEGLLRAAGAR